MRAVAIAIAGLLGSAAAAEAQQGPLQYRWVYFAQNLQVNSNVPLLQGIMQRAKNAGYNGIVLDDFKLSILDQVPSWYFTNVAAVKATAQQLGIDIYPSAFPVGYAEGLLAHDPNMIEAQPVRGALFIAGANGMATLSPEPAIALNNGGFESVNGNTFTGYLFQDGPGQKTFADTTTVHGGLRSIRMQNIGTISPIGMCRIAQTVAVSPWRQYHLSAWIKTDSFDRPGAIWMQALGQQTSQSLCSYNIGVQGTQNWTQHHIVFNSQQNTSVVVYFGVWGGNAGTLWWDDGQVEEVGLLNVVRRPGAPLMVQADGGSTVYTEGVDYQPVADARMGTVPWSGAYEVYHAAPSIQLTPGSQIQPGQRLRVSFYHAMTTDSDKAAMCLSEPGAMAILQDQVNRVYSLFQPRGLFMDHDEIRVMNWCQACQSRGLTPGQILADHVSRCATMCRAAASPSPEVFVWNDMFDPYHNAVSSYYLCNGAVTNSWAGIDSGIVIVNWNYGNRAQSLPFFASRGNRQILGAYYDGPVGNINTWINDAQAASVPLAGIMYTTWIGDYSNLEAFAQAAFRACCASDGSCQIYATGTCPPPMQSLVGVCSPNPCPQPTGGVCCRGATCSVSVAQGSCVASGLAGEAYVPSVAPMCTGNTVQGCCHADYNKVNAVTVQDIFDYLNDWFMGSAFARVGGDGSMGPLSVQNIFDFLGAWFGGC
jgi:hypothetical protein